MDFNDIASFALHLATLEVAVQRRAEGALNQAAQVIEQAAKDEIGHYQPAVGGHPAWSQLADATLAHHASMGVGDTPLMVTGELYASIEHESVGGSAVIGTKMDVGAYQEFGTDTIPPRPFMGPAAFTSKGKVEKIMARAVVAGLIGGNAILPEPD